MGSIIQSTMPVVKFFSPLNNQTCYQEFSPTSKYLAGKNLQSYSFSKSINNLEGQFELTFKEDIDNSAVEVSCFYNNVQPLDVVEFIENDKIQFIGIVMNKSYTAMASGLNKMISISGKSIEHLFSYLNISFNVTAMAQTDTNLNTTITALNSTWNMSKGENAITIKKFLQQAYSNYCEVAKKCANVTNTTVIDMINVWYGGQTSMFNVVDGISFQYPISSNMFTDDTVNFISYVRNLLPSNVYEIYGKIKNNKPVLCVREVPFEGLTTKKKVDPVTNIATYGPAKGSWGELDYIDIYPDLLTGYTLTRSIDEVYTAFYSYLEGSVFDQAFYENMQTIKQNGKFSGSYAVVDTKKVAKYGYVPLRVNFCGFNISVADEDQIKTDLNKAVKTLNEKIAKWYSHLDEMYDATISVVSAEKVPIAALGEKIKFLGGEFYVTGIEHQWQFGNPVKITYHTERGAKYSLFGDFESELTGVTVRLAELKS